MKLENSLSYSACSTTVW